MEQEICTLVEQTLKLEPGTVKPEDGEETLEAWDSLGLLSILSALEKKFGPAVTKIDDLASVTTVGGIAGLLEREGISE